MHVDVVSQRMYTVWGSSRHLSALCQILARPLEARMSGFMSPIERWNDKLYAPAELEYLFARSEIGYKIIAPLHGFAARDVKVDLARGQVIILLACPGKEYYCEVPIPPDADDREVHIDICANSLTVRLHKQISRWDAIMRCLKREASHRDSG